jgi:hypothetical protein
LTFGPGGAASVIATNVSVGSVTPPPAPEEVATGKVVSIAGTCPAVTVTLEGLGGIVVTSASTTFTPTGSCSALAAGQMIEAKGTRDATLQLVATSLEVETDASSAVPVGHGHKVAGEGTVAHVTGTCPSLALMVRGVRVTTSSTTTFVDGTCSEIRSGTKVLVTGETQSDGRIVAASVRITKRSGNGRS